MKPSANYYSFLKCCTIHMFRFYIPRSTSRSHQLFYEDLKTSNTNVSKYFPLMSKVRLNVEYCSHIWGAVPTITLHLPDTVEKKATKYIGEQVFSSKLFFLPQHWPVVSFFTDISMACAHKYTPQQFHFCQPRKTKKRAVPPHMHPVIV